ncbi:hypothetical protein [Nocardioides sp. Soil805]|uniref:hypothetical protein n=1 Tax=Nocardioides sp. Soil805 TaxID=1736416 RepID=UPI000703367D|nr:hypothetical protein [Nocardioides sp. Soil805]KRF34384.1 hypothetical protein ASG94_16950 [Nocardioides sp. Soil805]
MTLALVLLLVAVGFATSGTWLVTHGDGLVHRERFWVLHYAWGALPFLLLGVAAALLATGDDYQSWLVAVAALFFVWAAAALVAWIRVGGRTIVVVAHLAAGWAALATMALGLPPTARSG